MLPLQGRLILDCSMLLPGPFVGKLLATRGARVLKIESPTRPDPARSMTSYYADLNEPKELVWLDVGSPQDRPRFEELVREADGLVEGFRPQTKTKLGLDADTLHAINPKLCIASIVGYDENGPWRDRAGHDMNFQAVTGLASMFREMNPLPLADQFASYSAALGLTAMLDATARGAPGGRLVISMAEALKEVQSIWIREYRDTGQEPLPGSTLMSGKYPCYRYYMTKEGRKVAVGALERKFWEKACSILGVPDLAEHGLATGAEAERVAARVQEKFRSRSWAEWAPFFEGADCCVEPVLSYGEVY